MKRIFFYIIISVVISIFLISPISSSNKELYDEGMFHYQLGLGAMDNKNYIMAFQEFGKAAELFDTAGYKEMRDLSIDKSIEANKLQKAANNSSNSDNVSISGGAILIIIIVILLLLFMPSIKKSPKNYYQSNEWKQIASNIKRERGYKCQHCGWKSRDGRGLNVHHIVPRSRGGSNTPNNFVVLCKECHGRIHPHMKDPNVEY